MKDSQLFDESSCGQIASQAPEILGAPDETESARETTSRAEKRHLENSDCQAQPSSSSNHCNWCELSRPTKPGSSTLYAPWRTRPPLKTGTTRPHHISEGNLQFRSLAIQILGTLDLGLNTPSILVTRKLRFRAATTYTLGSVCKGQRSPYSERPSNRHLHSQNSCLPRIGVPQFVLLCPAQTCSAPKGVSLIY